MQSDHGAMDIRFVSTLTSDDEDLLAPMLLNAATSLLDGLPLAYTLRIETTARTVYQHHHSAADDEKDGAVEGRSPERQPSRKVTVPQC